ncbi:MAG: NTP transferase domain-containing protein [Crocinitomicaceae bacterium]|jgi:NDP-sugar pyrophosphorylase family protein|tara:strand:- start:5525 stop:6406 length:882 start_codon:yes stop_codon:yes gene_type:complete
MPFTLLILAGGLGTRYQGDKQLADLGPNGEFLLEYSIFDAINAGFDHVVIVSTEKFIPLLKRQLTYFENRVKLVFINQYDHDPGSPNYRIAPWGTAHAVLAAMNNITDAFMVINADDYYGADSYCKAIKMFKSQVDNPGYGLLSYKLSKTLSPFGPVSRGICHTTLRKLDRIIEHTQIINKNGRITAMESGLNDLDGEEQVSMNCWLLHADLFADLSTFFNDFYKEHRNAAQAECRLPDFIQSFLDKRVEFICYPVEEDWFGLTHPEDYNWCQSILNLKIDNGCYPNALNPFL